MFSLVGKTYPQDAGQLAGAIRAALAKIFSLPKEDAAVKVEGKSFPNLKKVKISLSGASVIATEPPPKPKPTGRRKPDIHVESLEIVGHPIKYKQNRLDLMLKARDLKFDFGRDEKGQPLLILTDARDGHVEAEIGKADLRSLLLTLARDLAEEQKIEVQELDLQFSSTNPRSVAANARIKAKKLRMSGILHIKGRLDVDDELNATVSDLCAEGEGVVGTLAACIVERYLKPQNGRKFPLMVFSLGDVCLRDLKIDVKHNLRVTAEFGGRNGGSRPSR